ncbi:MAG: hypothetical protein KC544_15775 [Gemmatimonadetes bacterium]|nr:hypothetical protein [Gemmatimonadota bacterium]
MVEALSPYSAHRLANDSHLVRGESVTFYLVADKASKYEIVQRVTARTVESVNTDDPERFLNLAHQARRTKIYLGYPAVVAPKLLLLSPLAELVVSERDGGRAFVLPIEAAFQVAASRTHDPDRFAAHVAAENSRTRRLPEGLSASVAPVGHSISPSLAPNDH